MDTYSNPLLTYLQGEEKVLQGYSRLENTADIPRVTKENTADTPRVTKENTADIPRLVKENTAGIPRVTKVNTEDIPRIINRRTGDCDMQGQLRLESVDCSEDTSTVINSQNSDHETQGPLKLKDTENTEDTSRVIHRRTGEHGMHEPIQIEQHENSQHSHPYGACVRDNSQHSHTNDACVRENSQHSHTNGACVRENSQHSHTNGTCVRENSPHSHTNGACVKENSQHGHTNGACVRENSQHSHTNDACVRDVRERISDVYGINSIGKCDYCQSSEPSLRMRELLEGLVEPGDCGNSAEPPAWLNRQLFHQGRRFYQRFLFCIFLSDLLSLLMIFSVSRILRPLIYSEKSDTPFKALKRYASTIVHIIRWYSGDVWDSEDDAHKDIQSVRSLHTKYANLFSSTKHHPHVDEVTVHTKGHKEPKCPFSSTLRSDLCSQVKTGYKVEDSDTPTLYISQWDMSVTQYAFMGLIVRHPHKLGAWWASESELEGFIHFWRGIGWLLGVDDRFNFCNGTLEETRALCLEMEQRIIRPGIAAGDWNFEHMCNSLIEGMRTIIPGLSTLSMTCFLADILGLSIPQFKQRMYKSQVVHYWFMRFVFQILFLVPGVVAVFNELLLALVDATQGRISGWARWLPRSWLPPTVTPHHYT